MNKRWVTRRSFVEMSRLGIPDLPCTASELVTLRRLPVGRTLWTAARFDVEWWQAPRSTVTEDGPRARTEAVAQRGEQLASDSVEWYTVSSEHADERCRPDRNADRAYPAVRRETAVRIPHHPDHGRDQLDGRRARHGPVAGAQRAVEGADPALHSREWRPRQVRRYHPRHDQVRRAAHHHGGDGLGGERRHAHLPRGASRGPLRAAQHALYDPSAARRRRWACRGPPDRGGGDPQGA